MKALIQTGSSGRVTVSPEKRFLISYTIDQLAKFWEEAGAAAASAK